MSKRTDPDDDEWFDVNKDLDPLAALKSLQSQYEQNDHSHREKLCTLIERAVTTYDRLREDENEIERFFEDRFWGAKSYRPNREKLLLHCMQYMVGAPNSSHKRYSTAFDYTKAVKVLIKEGCKLRDLYEDLMDRGGPYGVINADKEENEVDKGDGDEEGEDPEDDPNDSNRGEDEGNRSSAAKKDKATSKSVSGISATKRQSQSDNGSGRAGATSKSVRMFDAKLHVALTTGSLHNQILGLAMGERRWVLIERVQDEGKIKRYDAITLREETSSEP